MSIMGFTGVYFACVGESNVNVDSPACLPPSTIAHELAHQRGIAWEQECNFLGVLASVTSGMPDYAYLGAGQRWASSIWATPCIKRTRRHIRPSAKTLPEVNADLRDNNAYWDQFRDNVVEKVTDTVYDAALKLYGDANGMQSYSMVVEPLVAYYKDRFNRRPGNRYDLFPGLLLQTAAEKRNALHCQVLSRPIGSRSNSSQREPYR